jgi:hypothetical protein
MNTMFVSYYSDTSPSTFYKDSGLKLKKRIEILGGKIYLQELMSLGNYAANCLRKPKFILDCLQKFNQPIIWIDADSVVNSLPIELDNISEDVACVVKANGCPESALIYFNNTEKSKQFINSWIAGCSVTLPELDHPVLKELWYSSAKESRKNLPDTVCSVRTDSKVTIIMSKTEGKKEHTKKVINRRRNEGKVI